MIKQPLDYIINSYTILVMDVVFPSSSAFCGGYMKPKPRPFLGMLMDATTSPAFSSTSLQPMVGGASYTPLKNVSQSAGMMKFPIDLGKSKYFTNHVGRISFIHNDSSEVAVRSL